MSALGNLSARMRGTNISELSKAAKSGNVDEVSRLCGTGNPNARDPDGDRFPLHWAAANGHKECIQVLVSFDADTRVQDKKGRTPLKLAHENGHTALLGLLETRRGSIDQKLTKQKGKISREKYMQVFKLFDKDGDGKISQMELRNALSSLGQEPTEAELKQLIGGGIDGMYTNRDGSISFDNFVEMMTSGGEDESTTDLREAFKILDKEGKGYIGADELGKVCAALGEDLDPDAVEDLAAEALLGFDGKIYYDGLIKILLPHS